MRRDSTIALLIGLAAAAGCRDDAVDALEATRLEVCRCQNAACVNAAMDKLRDLPTRNRHKAEDIARRITDCAASIYRLSDAGPDEPPEDAAGAEPGSGSGSGSAGSGSAATGAGPTR